MYLPFISTFIFGFKQVSYMGAQNFGPARMSGIKNPWAKIHVTELYYLVIIFVSYCSLNMSETKSSWISLNNLILWRFNVSEWMQYCLNSWFTQSMLDDITYNINCSNKPSFRLLLLKMQGTRFWLKAYLITFRKTSVWKNTEQIMQ